MRTLHEQSQATEAVALTAGAKMSALCSFCVHHVAVNGEAVNAVNSNGIAGGQRIFCRNQLQILVHYVMMISLQKNHFFHNDTDCEFTVLCHVICGIYEEPLIWAFCLKVTHKR